MNAQLDDLINEVVAGYHHYVPAFDTNIQFIEEKNEKKSINIIKLN